MIAETFHNIVLAKKMMLTRITHTAYV
uniref:Uncharacterized protein n=1 Tax=Anguilla anguilla TaxID=7936 RepID=A0A0E9R787_ANGAN